MPATVIMQSAWPCLIPERSSLTTLSGTRFHTPRRCAPLLKRRSEKHNLILRKDNQTGALQEALQKATGLSDRAGVVPAGQDRRRDLAGALRLIRNT